MTVQSVNAASSVAQKPMSKKKKVLGGICAVTAAGVIGWMTYDDAPAHKARDRQIRADAVGEIGSPFVPIPKAEPPPAIPASARAPGGPVPPHAGMQLPALPSLPTAPRQPAPIAQFQASTTVS